MEHLLEKRVRYFLNSPYRGREDVRRTLRELHAHGHLVLIGGMLRDVAMFGNAGFKSDLDFVIDPYDLAAFEKHMHAIGARVNRFGGYALPSKRWQIDVWPLQRTWAHLKGYVRVSTVGDLRDVTFFSCDAIIYDLSHKKLSAKPGYFDDLDRKVLEINLRPNPNPKGNAVRAFRYALIKGFHWGPNLSRFVAETIDEVGWNALRESEISSFKTRYLDMLDLVSLKRELDHHLSTSDGLFRPTAFQRNVQLQLPYTQ
ncbi:MAG: hypothetical protein Q4G49_12165 [Paracoccus sp. (in: a-proteobacteria)]|nr:hypothetical protein [Paracoccus sp. (in: a-proteobacteria)]